MVRISIFLNNFNFLVHHHHIPHRIIPFKSVFSTLYRPKKINKKSKKKNKKGQENICMELGRAHEYAEPPLKHGSKSEKIENL